MSNKKEKLFEVIYSTTEWWKATVPGENQSKARFNFMNDLYDRSTEEHEYDAKKGHVDSVHIESCNRLVDGKPVPEEESEEQED